MLEEVYKVAAVLISLRYLVLVVVTQEPARWMSYSSVDDRPVHSMIDGSVEHGKDDQVSRSTGLMIVGSTELLIGGVDPADAEQ